MRHTTVTLLFLTLLLAPATGAHAQQIALPPTGVGTVDHFMIGNPHPQTLEVLLSEPLGEIATVEGAPFSAEAVTELTQTLPDGNRIERRFTTMLFRDSRGRTRREQQIVMMGPLTAAGVEPPRMVTISDPVSYQVFSLNHGASTAHRAAASGVVRRIEGSEQTQRIEAGVQVHHEADLVTFHTQRLPTDDVFVVGSAGVPLPNQVVGSAFFEAAVPVPPGAAGASGGEPGSQVVSRPLGTRAFDGVVAEGTRTTMTIPAGAIGNLAPIEVVTERWFSKELQTAVMITRNDPRSGETVYRLTNIVRGEPSPDLFTVPTDFTVIGDK